MQVIGFGPADLSDRYERLQSGKGFEREVLARRKNLARLYGMASEAGDMDMLESAQEKIQAFNEAQPGASITWDTLARSERGRRQAEKELLYGVRFNKKLRADIESRFFNDDED